MREIDVRMIVREELRHSRLIDDIKREMDLMAPREETLFLEALKNVMVQMNTDKKP